MRYLRFVKPPKLEGRVMKAMLTITTDLGESFSLQDAVIVISVQAVGNRKTLHRQKYSWKGGSRSMPIAIPLNNADCQNALLLVATSELAGDGGDIMSRLLVEDAGPSRDLIGAWSDPVYSDSTAIRYPRRVQRRFQTVGSDSRQLNIWEDTGESIARHIWDAGLIFAQQLSEYSTSSVASQSELGQLTRLAIQRRINVVELGCGCGISGISFAQSIRNTSVTLTDLPEAAEIALLNISEMTPASGSTARFEALDWEDDELPLSIASTSFDAAIVTDCTYNPDSSPALVRMLKRLQSNCPTCLILMAMKVRHESEDVFWGLMSEAGFEITSKEELKLTENDLGVEETILMSRFRIPFV